jgi:hypothetical protein
MFASAGSIVVPADPASVTLLADGRVLLVGGGIPEKNFFEACEPFYAPAEIYDPKSGAFGVTDPVITPRNYATTVLLRDGRVLVVGGNAPSSAVASGDTGMSVLDSAELFEP